MPAKENNSLTAKDAKDRIIRSNIKPKVAKTTPRSGHETPSKITSCSTGASGANNSSEEFLKRHLYATLGAVPSRPSGVAFDLNIMSFAAKLFFSFADKRPWR
jgi:hypothetical protein